ncbi:MAG TPA: hypothetical protein ENL03_00475 [Phycisphaerae bacterium]|nr:hypothetical protein [Phycisphaerae bacterium]
MKNWILTYCVLLLPALAAAEVGDLTYVVCKQPYLTSSSVYMMVNLTKPSPNAALLHPKAQAGSTILPSKVSVSIARDGATADAKVLDVLRFDFTGTGTFKDAIELKLKQVSYRSINSMHFSGLLPITLRLNGADCPAALTYAMYSDARPKLNRPAYLSFSVQMAVQGKCKFGRKTLSVRIFDRDGNGSFGKEAKPEISGALVTNSSPNISPKGDTFMVDFGDGSFSPSTKEFYWNQPFQVDGKWYKLKISANGKKVKAVHANVAMGIIAHKAEKWSVILTNKDVSLNIIGGPQGAAVPVGEYHLVTFQEFSAPDDKGRRGCVNSWNVVGTDEKAEALVVTKGKDTTLPAGCPLVAEPVIVSAGVSDKKKTIMLNMKLYSLNGGSTMNSESIETLGGGRPPAPKFKILDASGQAVHQGTLEYG